MADNTTPAAADEAPHRWCGNRAHLISESSRGRCRRCNTQTARLSKARNTGAKICENGHGLVQANLAEDGSCNECAFVEATILAPGAPVRPAPTTWLDWGAVAAALDGRELPRALSLREYACLITTLQVRRPEAPFSELIAWIADATTVSISESYANYIINQWWRRYGMPDPRITLEQAVFAECDGDAWIAEEIARLRAEDERAEAEATVSVKVSDPNEKRVAPATWNGPTGRQRIKNGSLAMWCKACAQTKPYSAFPMKGRGAKQLGVVRSTHCGPCELGFTQDALYRRRAREHGIPLAQVVVGTGAQRVTTETVARRYGDRCFYGLDRCSGAFDEITHYVRIVDHGPHTLDNTRPACSSCSRRRSRIDPSEAA